jgi:hypothetical protein
MADFGGATIRSISFTDAWGQSPGSGTASLVGSFAITAGQDFTVTLGGKNINGVVKNPVRETGPDGSYWNVSLVDNREKLNWDPIAASFNIVDTKSVDPDDFGKSRKRRYKHVYPDDWHAQEVTYTDNPLTAKQILDKIFAFGELRYHWTYTDHASLAKPVYNIDADAGTTLGNMVQQVLDKLSLLMCLTGTYQLTFAVKGEGSAPSYGGPNVKEYSAGTAMANNPTAVRIVGDRNLYQDINIALDPAWNSYWEDYVFEPDLWARVRDLWSMPHGTASERAALAAKMRKVTLAEWHLKTGSDEGDDYSRFGEVIRMDIPVWVYVNEIVWKAYQIDRDYKINDIDLLSMPLHEGLLARVTASATTGVMSYYQNDGKFELYTDDKAFIIARGQPLDLSDPAKKEVLDPATHASLALLWTPVQRFRFDPKNYTVIFEDPIFDPGTGDGALFLSINSGSDLPADHPSKYLAIPNAAAVLSPAPMKGSFCFAVERYHRDFGSGIRKGINAVPGLSLHSLLVSNVYQTEIKYDTDPQQSADDKAEKAAASFLAKQQLYASGSVKRLGTVGAALSGQIDRTSITYDTSGISEVIDYTKERSPSYFESERELERREASDDLFPGMQDNRQAVIDMLYMSKILAGMKPAAKDVKYRNINDVLKTPVGNTDSAPTTLYPDEAMVYDAGEAVFGNGKRVIGDEKGTVFLGVTIAKGHVGGQPTEVATQGDVPVKVTGPVTAGDRIGCDVGSRAAKKDGTRVFGTVKETYAGTQTVWLPVRLGAGESSSGYPFQGHASSYTGGDTPPPQQARKFKLRLGQVNNLTPSNMTAEFTCPANSSLFVWAKATISTGFGDAPNRVTALELASGTDVPDTPAGDEDAGTAPEWTARGLVKVTCDATAITTIEPLVKDSQWVVVHVSSIDGDTGAVTYDVLWSSAGAPTDG